MYSKKQYLIEVQKEYLGADKTAKTRLLDETQKRTSLNRKYLIRRLSAKTRWTTPRKTYNRACEYGVDLIEPLIRVWDIFDEPCGQRLSTMLGDEVDRLITMGEIFIDNTQAQQLKKMSAKTIDRLLEHEKAVRLIAVKYEKHQTPLLYEKIPTKMSHEWDDILGQVQIDAVEHAGHSAKGEYAHSISTTDIKSQWWEGEVVMGKGKTRTLEAIKRIRQRYPFEWKEIHPDNGSSFINQFLYDYTQAPPRLAFSRSRPYKKNDNCLVEQKNSQNVRHHVGHVRYDTPRETDILNSLYRDELRVYKNFFQPVMRLETKERMKGHVYRRYQKAKTPYRYLMDDPSFDKDAKAKLKVIYDTTNPAKLKRSIEKKIRVLSVIYQAKHRQVMVEGAEISPATVTFSFDPTDVLRLPSLVT